MIYIVSDVHLGLTSSLKPEIARENFITFVNGIESGAHLYILGDLFDFYLRKGNKLIFGDKYILELLHKCTQRGIKISVFSGNHDFWLGNCLKSYGIDFIRFKREIKYGNRRLFLSHGDMFFKGSRWISLINWLSKSHIFYVLARTIPEDILFNIIKFASSHERNPIYPINPYLDFCKKNNYDIFILGHYHTTDIIKCNNKILITPGDFATKYTYLRIDDKFIYLIKKNKVINKIRI
ncbi:metallophosphoesterase [candidate division WOR-3 bacterium]|nr:metallophosphoesterase [candidate division WOR-3 bacterium]